MIKDRVYTKLLIARMKYFSDKKITDLTRVEIKEYLSLQVEIQEEFKELKEVVSRAWDAIEPYAKACLKYHERVIQNKTT